MNTPKKSQNPWRNHCVSSFDEKHWQGSVDTNLCQTTQRIISAHRTKSFPTLPSLVKRVLPLKHLWNHYIYVYIYIHIHLYTYIQYIYIHIHICGLAIWLEYTTHCGIPSRNPTSKGPSPCDFRKISLGWSKDLGETPGKSTGEP